MLPGNRVKDHRDQSRRSSRARLAEVTNMTETKKTVCRRADKPLTDAQLKEIAGLIYDTDQFIYPAMFSSRQEAESVISKMIRAGDQMFRRENMFVAMNGKQVDGVLVWMRGPLQWDKKIYEKCGGKSAYIDRVVAEYFSLFADAPADMATMVRIGVQQERRGDKIGRMLMDTFMEAEKGPYQLFVLSDNTKAISFFESMGFRIRETRPGFSLDYQVPPCFWMVKG